MDLANTTNPERFTWACWLAGKKNGSIYFSIGTTNLRYCSEVRHSQPLGHNAAHDSSILALALRCAALLFTAAHFLAKYGADVSKDGYIALLYIGSETELAEKYIHRCTVRDRKL